MDYKEPKTRRQTKKDQTEKSQAKGIYSSKHIRIRENGFNKSKTMKSSHN